MALVSDQLIRDEIKVCTDRSNANERLHMIRGPQPELLDILSRDPKEEARVRARERGEDVGPDPDLISDLDDYALQLQTALDKNEAVAYSFAQDADGLTDEDKSAQRSQFMRAIIDKEGTPSVSTVETGPC